MNYSNTIHENKEYAFVKQLMYNISLAICLILIFTLILVYGFKFQLYNVLSDSEAPYFYKGDMLIVRAQDEYEVGDIIKFTHYTESFPVAHRLIGKVTDNGKTYYICHGDAVATSDPHRNGQILTWQEESEFVESLTYDQLTGKEDINGLKIHKSQIQIIEKSAIDGKVLGSISNYGTYITFIKDHAMLVITILVSIWCISGVVQNEIDIKNMKRLKK